MASKKISELTEATSGNASMEMLVNDSGTSKRITRGNLLGTSMTGPSSSTDSQVVLYDGTGGNVTRASTATIDSSGNLTVTGDLTVSGDDITMGTNTSGHLLIADGTNYNPVGMSGDTTISSAGAVTIANDAITSAKIADGAIVNADINASAAIATSKISGLATSATTDTTDASNITSGTLPIARVADNAVTLAKLEDGTQGDVLYYGSSGAPARLSAGTSGQVLTTGGSGANPSWSTPTTADITSVVAGDGLTGGATSGDATLNVVGGTGITANANDIAIDSTVTTLTGSQTLTNKTLTSAVLNTGISGTAVKDEDDMSSNSATHLSTQQSIKSYVDDSILTEEQVEDFVGGMVTGNTETFITVSYEDSDGTLDFVVPVKDEDDMTSDSATHLATQQSIKAYVDAQADTTLTQEQVEDYVGGMLDGTETFISVSYDDTDGNIDFVVPVKDEDTMSSNSDTFLATQQSIKAYVDSQTESQLTQEQVEDYVGGMLDGTETFISVSYDDTDGNIDFVVPVKDEDNMSSDSATHLATQQSIKAYVDGEIASTLTSEMTYKGGYNASSNSPDLDSSPSGVKIGDMYTVTHAGNFFTVAVEVGDVLIAETDGADEESEWTVVSKDLTAGSIKTLYESNSDTNEFSDAEQSKLAGIEASADVTDTANVTAAGALMDTEVDADIKTLSLPASTTISTFGATLVDDADASTARTTLGVDASGTDNSTNVTLSGTPDYITISGQTITRNTIDIGDDTNLTAGTGLTLSGDTLNVDASQTGITAVGTIATGTWQGTAVADSYVASASTWNTATTTANNALPKAGGTMTGDIDLGDNTLANPEIKDYKETVQSLTGNQTVNTALLASGNVINWSGSGTVTLDTPSSTYHGVSFTLIGQSAMTIAETSTNDIFWSGGTTPTPSGICIYNFVCSLSASSTYKWFGFSGGEDFAT